MKVNEFITLLRENSGQEVRFKYDSENFVSAAYHLTEVKNVIFDTTDCGGKTNHWKETHVQLWEDPAESGKTLFMTSDKLLAILNRVNGIKALWPETEIKVEYGNRGLNTGVMPVREARASGKYLDFLLFEESALCKARIPSKQAEDHDQPVAQECCEQTSCC